MRFYFRSSTPSKSEININEKVNDSNPVPSPKKICPPPCKKTPPGSKKKKINFACIKKDTINSLNEVEHFLCNFQNICKYIKLYKILK